MHQRKGVTAMARIAIKALPRDTKISREEMKRVLGGLGSINWTTPKQKLYFLGSPQITTSDPITGESKEQKIPSDIPSCYRPSDSE